MVKFKRNSKLENLKEANEDLEGPWMEMSNENFLENGRKEMGKIR